MAGAGKSGFAEATDAGALRARLVRYAGRLLVREPLIAALTTADDLAQEALLAGHTVRTRGFEPAHEAAYLEAIVRNAAFDAVRRHKRTPRPAEIALAIGSDGSTADERDADPGATAQEAVRGALDRLAEAKNGRAAVCHHAVFLVHVRIRLAAGSARSCLSRRPEWAAVESAVPWREREKVLAFRTGWPSIEKIWAELAGNPTCLLCPDGLGVAVGSLDPRLSLGRDRWYQWVRRSVVWARAALGEADRSCLGRLLDGRFRKAQS